MKKIIIIIPGMYYGGMERVAFITRQILIDNGYDVSLITLYNNDADYEPDFEYETLDCGIKISRIGKIFNIFKRVYKMRQAKRRINKMVPIRRTTT